MHAAKFFDKTTITTVVPNRYLERPSLPSLIFPGTLKVESPIKAIEQAYKESTVAKLDVNRIVLWTDGSGCQSGKQGLAFAWRYSEAYGWGPWEAFGYKATGANVSSTDMEFLAVIKALDWASEVTQKRLKSINAVAIYTDAQGVIEALRQNSYKRPLALHVVKRAAKLIRLAVSDVSIHWVPGHSKVK
ncbi:hypothetical protein DM02DRAFT_119377 [Periconia macrospinosa]|uniref:RNase H type-1 domain-containing protein n=1 Tax=Periconia macrospinosa TaxID=97972 RepID=A0A2V1DED3_9PLEO|nr:hypothetical protein DM02DRAFT_119377 [Periconia macrospinosa]